MLDSSQKTSFTDAVSVALAYDRYGYPKRTVGVYYDDIDKIWSREDQKQWREEYDERATKGRAGTSRFVQ